MNNTFAANQKVLIISTWAPPMIGGPQNLYNLFSQFPKDSFFILTSQYNIKRGKQSDRAGTWLPCKYYYYDREQESQSKEQHHAKTLHRETASIKQKIARILLFLPFIGKTLYDYLAIIYTLRILIKKAVAVTKITKATQLMGISDVGIALIATFFTHQKTKIPYTLYFFDIYKDNLLEKPYKLLAKIFERPLLTNASLLILTNEESERYYKRRYGEKIRTAVVHNSVFAELYRNQRSPYNPKPPFDIVFTGNVHWPQEQSLLNLINAMNFLQDLPLRLHLYVPKPTENLKKEIAGKRYIQLYVANQSEIPQIQSNATLLFLPLSWNTKSPDIIATATPGKFTDYLASGRPILVHAPDYAYISRYTKKHKLGLVVDQNNVEVLADAIRSFLRYPSRAEYYIKNALSVFHKNHDAHKNVKKLADLLNKIENS